MTARSEALVVMAKRPRAGEVKTRLTDVLGAEGAAELYEAMLGDVLQASRPPECENVLAFAPADERAWFEAFAPARPWELLAQEGPDLGVRMQNVFDRLLARHEGVVMRNSDSPDLAPDLIDAAFAALRDGADTVLGPDEGGGYYLIGLRAPQPSLFEVLMSTRDNFAATRARAEEGGRRVEVLPMAPDVDEAADLAHLRTRLAAHPDHAPRTATWLAARRRP